MNLRKIIHAMYGSITNINLVSPGYFLLSRSQLSKTSILKKHTFDQVRSGKYSFDNSCPILLRRLNFVQKVRPNLMSIQRIKLEKTTRGICMGCCIRCSRPHIKRKKLHWATRTRTSYTTSHANAVSMHIQAKHEDKVRLT